MTNEKSGFLTFEQRNELTVAHRPSQKARYADRIKTILMLDDGYSYEEISRILLLDESTLRRYFQVYQTSGLLALISDNYQPYAGKLSDSQ